MKSIGLFLQHLNELTPDQKKEKLVSDIQMILEPSNLFPLNGWFGIWKQLLKDIVLG